VADRAQFETAQTFETALITWGQWRQSGERELTLTDEGGGVRVAINTGGQPFEIKTKTLEADVRTPKHPVRLGIALTQPVALAEVTLTITPIAGEGRKTAPARK